MGYEISGTHQTTSPPFLVPSVRPALLPVFYVSFSSLVPFAEHFPACALASGSSAVYAGSSGVQGGQEWPLDSPSLQPAPL